VAIRGSSAKGVGV